jgi:CDP-paratose synthetase
VNILLTGGSGFLGSALAARWMADGHALTLLLRPSSSLRRLEALRESVHIVRCKGDDDIAAAVREAAPDVVVHTACSYGRRGESTLQTFDANTRLGLLLVGAALEGGDRRIDFVNTGTVLAPHVNAYALSKRQFSDWGALLARRDPARLRFVNVRLQHMYGPHDDETKFTTHVIRALRRNEPRLALTAGEQRRDFVYIDDVVDAYETIRAHLDGFDAATDIDLGFGEAPTVRQFVETAHALAGSTTVLDFGAVPYRPDEAMHCQADVAALARLGWRPRFGLREGLLKTIETESRP